MARITIIGAGITGMAIASALSKFRDVTTIAPDLPGDPDSLGWASPWAGRRDGTVILGGIKQIGNTDPNVDVELRKDVHNAPRARDCARNVPIKEYRQCRIRDIVGIRPGRVSGIRIEKEVANGEKIIHAYGTSGGGFSFGLAKAAAELVDEFVFASPKAML
ncbi:hypothetical protein AJ79_02277 [Helicocarpus griseus UAMH5409]|uniref:FAD dependent oxidoreductase domain-containing protein n=1 Tax=Helicocarpus griseus UAMH5409 TaxID=1447875 RepID=A0A2B7Y3S6_9EURO|nr:hypothetical protein AJ79_02277 [Helicocarpus griseus UAMH5409]